MTPRRDDPRDPPRGYTPGEPPRTLYSRTEDKKLRERDEEALLELAETLVGLNRKQLTKMALSERQQELVDATQRISSPAARQRSLRLLRAALRGDEGEEVKQRLQTVLDPSRSPNSIERWRERLVEDGDEALSAFIEAHPNADRQQLRQLLRNVEKAKDDQARVICLRALSKVLRVHLG